MDGRLGNILCEFGRAWYTPGQVHGERTLWRDLGRIYMILHFVRSLATSPQGFVFLVTRLIPRNMQPTRSRFHAPGTKIQQNSRRGVG